MNSFDCDYEMRWKRLFEKYKEKKMLLESDLQSEMEQLERRLAAVRHEYKTEKLKMELMEREAEAMLKGRPMFGCQGGNFGGMGMQDDLCDDQFDAVRNGRYEEEHIQRMPYQQGTKRGAADSPWYLEKKRQRF
ncbi:uncharacterized protein [Panulirus ornatus]|uniref:uncharacterized protein n=1 Tax=Panulirus ornatus TaxID=150431 RepID=UPI003A88A891